MNERTVTVTSRGSGMFRVRFSQLPGKSFGDWEFAETVRDLTVSALLSSIDARNLVLDASSYGIATSPVG